MIAGEVLESYVTKTRKKAAALTVMNKTRNAMAHRKRSPPMARVLIEPR